MKNTCLKVKIGPGNIKNLENIKAYLTAILPLWQEASSIDEQVDIIIGTQHQKLEPAYFIDSTSIDEIMASEVTRVALANSLKLIAAELWLKEA